MADLNPNISVITFNVNGLNTPIKSRDLQSEFFKTNQLYFVFK